MLINTGQSTVKRRLVENKSPKLQKQLRPWNLPTPKIQEQTQEF